MRVLLLEYTEWLAIDLCFQNFDHELANLPEVYGRPGGQMLLAEHKSDSEVVTAGCVGLRSFDDLTCEMKRLYVRPAYRGAGLGRSRARNPWPKLAHSTMSACGSTR